MFQVCQQLQRFVPLWESQELLSQGLDIMTDVPRLVFAFNQNKIVQDHPEKCGFHKGAIGGFLKLLLGH